MLDVLTVLLKRLSRRQTPPDRLEHAKSILQDRGNHGRLTKSGRFVVLNDGVEFASTSFVMLLILRCFKTE